MLNHPPLDGRNVTLDRRMSYEDMRRAVELTRPAPHVFEEGLPENINGVYDELTHIIVIDPRLNERQKRCTLAHELLHWTHGDARCQSQYDDKAETHVRKETATLLINPFDYIQSERVYEGEAFLVAVDLNVTVGVLEDYRSILEDAPTLAVEPKGCPQSSFSASPTLSAALRLHS